MTTASSGDPSQRAVGIVDADVRNPRILLPVGVVQLFPQWGVGADKAVEAESAQEEFGFEGVVADVGEAGELRHSSIPKPSGLDEEVRRKG